MALLFAMLAASVYRSSVFSEFTPIRIGVIAEEQTASRRVITVPLPDLSALRGHTAILGFQVRNRDSEPKRIGLLGDGLPSQRIVVPPNRTISWNIVLSPETVQTLHARSGEARTLELTADAGVWSVMAFEIRNYHDRWGDRAVIVTSAGADRYISAPGLVPVAFALVVLALLSAFAPASQRRSIRLAGRAVMVTASLAFAACLIVPAMSPYKILLSPSVFWLVAACLFVRALLDPLRAPRALVGTLRSVAPVVARGWKRREVTFELGAALAGLAAIAVAQPIFEVVVNSPEFFPARSTPPLTIIGGAFAICFGPPLVLLATGRVIGGVSRNAATTFHGIVIALLTTALVMPWFRRSELLSFPWDVVASGSIGFAVAVAFTRLRVMRQFFTALAPAAVVVPLLFLLDPGVKQSFAASESAASLETMERTPPIVLVIFDEFPLNTLLDADGNLDTDRFPHFGALAKDAYWFRNASTVAYTTLYAVPAILSGRLSLIDKAAPTLRYYPVNLFTALARRYNIFASLRFQQLCPARACRQNAAIPGDSVPSLLSDLGLVWLHIVLPERWTEALPPVVGEWAEFGRTREAPTVRTGSGRGAVFAQFLSSIDDRSASLHVLHLVLPHMPFEYVSSGRRYRGPDYQSRMYRGKGLFERVTRAYADTLHQRHLAQVGFADRLIGDLIGRLREVGAYDKALVIVTADHGASYREGQPRRQPRPQQRNISDVIQVPLLVKTPGQRQGEVVDRIAETVDILPTILDVLGAQTSLRFDGRSLIDRSIPERSPRTFFLYNRLNRPPVAVGDLLDDRAASLARKAERFGSGDVTGLYAPPNARHLLGTTVAQSRLRPAPDVQITIHNPAQFEAVKLEVDPLPIYVRGFLTTSRPDPLDVAVVVNGVVTAIAHSFIEQAYTQQESHTFGTLIPESALREGKNTVEAFVIDKF